MKAAWQRELTRLAGWLVLWLLAGVVSGAFTLCLLLGVGLYLTWHFVQVYRLSRWLQDPQGYELPDGSGIWEEVYRAFRILDRRNRRSQSRLENLVSQYEASTAALPDATVVLNRDGHIAWFNEAAVTLLGFRSPQDLGQRVVNLIRHPAFTQYLQAGHYERDIEIPSAVNVGSLLSIRVIPYGQDQRLLIARDVSQQQRLEQMRRDFVANASHELRTPLTVLRGYLDVMAEESTQPGPLQSWKAPLADMVRQATRMANIIEDLLKLARIEANTGPVRHEVVEVPALLHKLVEEARAMSGGAQAITLEAEPGLALYGHPSELQSIFSNLIHNAIQYTPAGGDIHVRWWSDPAGLHFSVTDSGIGIERKHIPRLTERFYRVDPSRFSRTGGTGLGLAIVKHALEHHEGRLEIASEINVGSTFTCHFPEHRAHRRNAA
jgi:two-component system, OmpR family, phosphate regulon sensor histidine kinase PhoR